MKSIIITGANAGIGRETARQFALKEETKKIILAGRNEQKLNRVKEELEKETNRSIFEILVIDVSDLGAVRTAVDKITNPIDALVMNAGGLGGASPNSLTKDGVTSMFAVNVLGHALLLQELLKRNVLSGVALFAGSEAISGVPFMGMKRPTLQSSSVADFSSIIDGSLYGNKFDPNTAYGATKYVGVMWLAALSRKYPKIKFVSVSPGSTKGTEVANDMPAIQKFFMKHIMMPLILPIFGLAHNVEKAASRYVYGIYSDTFVSGGTYASRKNKLTGKLHNQALLFPDLVNENFQDNAYAAVQKFIIK